MQYYFFSRKALRSNNYLFRREAKQTTRFLPRRRLPDVFNLDQAFRIGIPPRFRCASSDPYLQGYDGIYFVRRDFQKIIIDVGGGVAQWVDMPDDSRYVILRPFPVPVDKTKRELTFEHFRTHRGGPRLRVCPECGFREAADGGSAAGRAEPWKPGWILNVG